MSQFRQFWIRFRIGYDEPTHQITDVSLNPIGNYKEDFHVIEIAALEAAHKEIENLKKENSIWIRCNEWYQERFDEDEIKVIEKLTAALKVAEDAIEREMKWRTVKYCTNDGLDNLREALNEIQKIKKGLR